MNDVCETVLDVSGMTCASCTRHVDRALRDVEGVLSVDVKLRDGKARVRHEAAVQPDELLQAVEGAGYGSRLAS